MKTSLSILLLGFLAAPVWAEETIHVANAPALNGTIHVEIIGPQSPKPELSATENPKITPLDIIDAIETKSLDVQQSRLLITKSQWERNGAAAHLLPSVGFDYNVEKVTGSTIILNKSPLSVQRTTYRPRAVFGYQLSTGLTPVWDITRGQLQVNRSKQASHRVLQKSLADALNQYYTWLYYSTATETAKQSLSEATLQKKHDEDRYQAGFGTQLDVEQARVLELERQNDVLMVENNAITARIELQAMLNQTPGLTVNSPGTTLEPIRVYNPAGESLETLYAIANAKRPDLKELNTAIKEAKTSLVSALSSTLPVISVNGYFADVGPEKGRFARSFQRGMTVSWNTLDYMGLEKLSQIQIERLKIKDAILQKEKALQTLYTELAKAFYDWQLAKNQLETLAQKVESAQDALEIAQARQQLGLGIHLEVIQAQTKLSEARQDYLKAVMKYNNSQISLLYQTGQLTPDGLRLAYLSEAQPTKTASDAHNPQDSHTP